MSSAHGAQIYRVKSRERTEILDAQEVVLGNGRSAVSAQYPA